MMPVWAMNLPWEKIKGVALAKGLSPLLVAAIIWQESRGETWRTRFEPTWNPKQVVTPEATAKALGISAKTEVNAQMHSYGLMQIMGATARWKGFKGYLPQLCLPETGIEWGCTYLRWLVDKYKYTDQVLAAYNAGSPRRSIADATKFVNQSYVDAVLGYLRELEGADIAS